MNVWFGKWLLNGCELSFMYTAPPSLYHRRQRTRNGIAVDAITHYYLTFIFIDLFCDHDIYLLISTVVKFKLFIQRDCNLIHSNESLLLVQQSETRALGTQLYAHRKLKNCTENHKMLLTLFGVLQQYSQKSAKAMRPIFIFVDTKLSGFAKLHAML